tara:strand:- start:8969 stop:9565 length:597 start_codon:yes stop_codon:yes gene_type:complete
MSRKVFILCLFALYSCGEYKEEKYPVGHIETPVGEIYFWLYEETPLHRSSFIELAKAKYWDGLNFNRVIENFVIQGGCPDTPEGFGASDYLIEPEFVSEIKHVYGAVGMGRDDNPEKYSAGCQFYIVHDVEIPRLDQKYTLFGQVFKGLDVLDIIASLPTDANDSPLKKVPIKVRALELNVEEIKFLGGAKFLEITFK